MFILHAVYVARNSHLKILKLEQTLLNGDISALIDASSVSFDHLFSTVEEHVQDISNLEKPVFGGNVEDYLAHTNMNRSGTWGNTEEVIGLSHLLNTPVYSYIPSTHNWVRICPNTVDPTLFIPVTQKSIYTINERNDNNEGMHF